MSNLSTRKLGFRLILLTLLLLSLWVLSGSTQEATRDERHILVNVTQLNPTNGLIPVELECGAALISQPDKLERFSCSLRNNTDKNILAAIVSYSIIFESDGKEVADRRFHTVETFVHPDFYEAGKSILPGRSCTIEPPGPSSYANSILKRVEVQVEYVEFEDKSSLGLYTEGPQIIANIREGATKFKKWLTQKYIDKGRSEMAIVPLLETDEPLPSEIGLVDSFKQQGARAYKVRLRHIHQTRGAGQLDRYLNK